MYQFKKIGEHQFVLKARWVELISFKLIWSNDAKLPLAKFIGLGASYPNSFKSFCYRIDLSSINIINKKLKINFK